MNDAIVCVYYKSGRKRYATPSPADVLTAAAKYARRDSVADITISCFANSVAVAPQWWWSADDDDHAR